MENTNCFYRTPVWGKLKRLIYKVFPKQCMRCLSVNAQLHVDHIKPRSKFPDIELSISNLQVLCKACNLDKSNLYIKDYRTQKHVDALELFLAKGIETDKNILLKKKEKTKSIVSIKAKRKALAKQRKRAYEKISPKGHYLIKKPREIAPIDEQLKTIAKIL